ncbi:MAG: ubiquinol-cytochrome c reductase iron-sulfur subunit [Rubrobacteraceae bacterium]
MPSRRIKKSVSRREFLGLGAAASFVAAAGAPLLASCGGPDLPELDKDRAIIEAKKLETNSAFTFVDAGTEKPYVLVRMPDERFVLYSAECTHKGCTVGYEPEGQYLICPCHNSKFRAEDGDVLTGPADKPLPELAVRVVNGKVVSV